MRSSFRSFRPVAAAAKPAADQATTSARSALDAETIAPADGAFDLLRERASAGFAQAGLEITDADLDLVVVAVNASARAAL